MGDNLKIVLKLNLNNSIMIENKDKINFKFSEKICGS